MLIAANQTVLYPSVYFIPAPNALEGAAVLNQGIGDELVDLNATIPSGLSIQFYGSNLTNTIYYEIDAGSPSNVEFTMTSAPGIAPGNYQLSFEATSGTFSVKYSFTVQVVQYLVSIDSNQFGPRTMTVPAGSTVFWLNLDLNDANVADVIFNTIDLASPVLNPSPAFNSWSYTFTTPGTYLYHDGYLPGNASTGTIIVTG